MSHRVVAVDTAGIPDPLPGHPGYAVDVPEGTALIAARAFYNSNSENPLQPVHRRVEDPDSSRGWRMSTTPMALVYEVTLPHSIREIGEHAFGRCRILTAITLPPSLTEIAYGTFCKCTSLAEITLPPALTEIGIMAFSDCTSLAGITLPPTLAKLGGWAFQDCTSLSEISLPPNLTEIGESAFCGCTSLSEITLPPNLTKIGKSAFFGCTSLIKIVLPPNLTEIGMDAFNGCGLVEVRFPAGPVAMGANAFAGCHGLLCTVLHLTTASLTTGPGRVFSAVEQPVAVTIPAGTTEIAPGAFRGWAGLVSVNFDQAAATLNAIRYGAFRSCTGLRSIVVPDAVGVIEGMAFAEAGLIAAMLPGGLAELSDAVGTVTAANPGAAGAAGRDRTRTPAVVDDVLTDELARILRGQRDPFIDPLMLLPPDPAELANHFGLGVDGNAVISEGAFDGCASLAAVVAAAGIVESRGGDRREPRCQLYQLPDAAAVGWAEPANTSSGTTCAEPRLLAPLHALPAARTGAAGRHGCPYD